MLIQNLLLYQDRYFIRVNGENDVLFYFFDYDVRTEDKNMQFQHFHTFYELCVMMGPNTRTASPWRPVRRRGAGRGGPSRSPWPGASGGTRPGTSRTGPARTSP